VESSCVRTPDRRFANPEEVSRLDRANLLQAKLEGFLLMLKIVNIIFNSKNVHGS